MITSDQQKWIDHLSDKDKIVIKPYDPSCNKKFEKVKCKIQSIFGNRTEIKHCGATSLKISGQDEIDVYIPVIKKDFNSYIPKLTKLFGELKSYYPLRRARFVTEIDKKHIDVFLINSEANDWINLVNFENYLRNNPKSLEEYKKLKEDGDGLNVRQYYTRKIEFINEILKKVEEVL